MVPYGFELVQNLFPADLHLHIAPMNVFIDTCPSLYTVSSAYREFKSGGGGQNSLKKIGARHDEKMPCETRLKSIYYFIALSK